MHLNAETSSHASHVTELITSSKPMTKLDMHLDKRLIPFGSILRAVGLDEMPQVINIFKGEMSLVGPRPCTEYEYAAYLPWQKERFEALPGITGLWQVSGKNNTTFNEMIKFDIHYKNNCSLLLDLKIILLTLPVSVSQTRAFLSLKQHRSRNSKSAPDLSDCDLKQRSITALVSDANAKG